MHTMIHNALYNISQRLQHVPGGPKNRFNYVNIMPCKLQNTSYLYCLSNFNICY